MGYFNNSNNSLGKLTGTMPSLSSTPMPKLLGGMPDLNAGNISKVELAKGGEIGQYSNDRYGKQQDVTSGRSLINDLQNSSIGELGQLMNMQANASKDATQTAVSAQKELMNAQKGGFAGVVTGGGERGGFGMGATNQPEKGSYWDAGSGVTKTITSTFGGGGGGGSYGGGDSSPKVGAAGSISLGTKLAQGAADAGIQAMQNKNQLEYQRSLHEMESASKQKERDWQSQMERERDARQNANQKNQMQMQSQLENQRLRNQSQLENQRLSLQSQLEMQKIGAQSQANMQSSMMQGMFGMLGGVGGGSSSGYRYW